MQTFVKGRMREWGVLCNGGLPTETKAEETLWSLLQVDVDHQQSANQT